MSVCVCVCMCESLCGWHCVVGIVCVPVFVAVCVCGCVAVWLCSTLLAMQILIKTRDKDSVGVLPVREPPPPPPPHHTHLLDDSQSS